MVELKPISKLDKFQRREYYRFNTNIEASICLLAEYEMKEYLQSITAPENYINKKENAIIVDISGGGVKVVSDKVYNKNDLLLIEFNVMIGTLFKNIIVPGKVTLSTTSDKRLDLREHRIEYYEIPTETRELIIKYIFDEQRRILQKERW